MNRKGFFDFKRKEMKTILITGSTDGIGKLTAIKLAQDGHQILIHGRSTEKVNDTVATLKEFTQNNAIVGFVADLSDFESIKKMIAQLANNYTKIDVLINNAGIYGSNKQPRKDHLDNSFVVNYLAPFLLTNGLISLLRNSNSPRVINLSSAAQSTVSLKALAGKEPLAVANAYAQSKLALTMWSFDFAKKHPDIITIAVNPGSLLNTKMVQEAYGQYWSSADKGADILYELAVSEKYLKSSEKYFDNDKGVFGNAHNDAYNQEIIVQLIAETEKILNL